MLDGPTLGLDIEWNIRTDAITILGMADTEKAVSVSYNDRARLYLQTMIDGEANIFVGHNVVAADVYALEKDGISIPVERCRDTILMFYLNNMHLCKVGGKSSIDGGSGEKKGRGFMNLGTMQSVYTTLPLHKYCTLASHQEIERVKTDYIFKSGKKKGEYKYKSIKRTVIEHECNGPCPEHDPFRYNGIDSISPVLALPQLEREMKLKGVAHLYPIHAKLAYVLAAMRDRGVPVDPVYLAKLRGDFIKEKSKAKIALETRFNPNSVPQIISYFRKKYKFNVKEMSNAQEQTIRDLSEKYPENEELLELLEYKELGNGPDRWFAPRVWDSKKGKWDGYVDENNRVHPNFNFFTSSGRMACIAKGTLIEIVRDVSKYPKGIPIEKVKVGDWAYCFDRNNKLELKKVIRAGKTGKKKIIRLHWRSGSNNHTGYLDLTSDHKVYMLNGEYRRADQLKSGDRLSAMGRGINKDGYARLWPSHNREIAREHRFVFEKVKDFLDQAVHHKNGNKLDNRTENLETMSHSEHAAIHLIPYSRDPKTREERRRRQILHWKQNREQMLKTVRRGEQSHNWLGLEKDWLLDELWKVKGNPTEVTKKYGIDYATLQKYMKMHSVSWIDIRRNFNRRGDRITKKLIKESLAVADKGGYDAAREFVGLGWSRWREKQIEFGFDPHNHVVTKIEKLNQSVDVYDLTIEDCHNFIANEICVHNCSSPNLQNVAARRVNRKTGENMGKMVRRACAAPEGYWWCKADYSSAENRVMLYHAGYIDLPEGDFPIRKGKADLHLWMKDMIGIKESDPFALALGSARDAAKSVTHATNYWEGLQLVDSITGRIKKEVEKGTRVVYPDWKFNNKIVTFTGVNLAKRAFGSATDENRRRALDIQIKYFKQFPKLIDLGKKITKLVEIEGCVRPPHGYSLASFGASLEDRLKTAASVWGSQPVSHLTKLALLRAEEHPHLVPILQVHDEIDFLVEKCHDPKDIKSWVETVMCPETKEMPGLKIPVDVSLGPNWSEQKEI